MQLQPRSIQVAGVATAIIVVLGLAVAHAAKPDSSGRPALVARTSPGAASVERAEAHLPTPAITKSAVTTAPPTPTPTPDPVSTSDASEPDVSFNDSGSQDNQDPSDGWFRDDWKQHGNGRGRGHWRN